jgi:hypothetical protein
MALVSINASETAWHSDAPLMTALMALPASAAVTIMIHGFRFAPGVPGHDPHDHILSLRPVSDCWKAVSWPRHLHLDRTPADLGIAFGWPARGSLAQVARRAFAAGRVLADLIGHIRATRPDLNVHLFAHSLGARAALSALGLVGAGDVSRIILLSGAEYQGHARGAMASPAGRSARVLNVTSGENAPFDWAFRICVPAPTYADPLVSAGDGGLSGWTDLRIDCPDARAALLGLGRRIPPPKGRICHWSSYLRPGLFGLYRAVLGPTGSDVLDQLAGALAAQRRQDPAQHDCLRASPL